MADEGFKCHTLRNGAGGRLVVQGERVLAKADLQASACVALCIPNANRHMGWLVAPDTTRLDIFGNESPGIAIPVKLDGFRFQGQVKILHAVRRWCYLGLHPDEHRPPGEVSFSHKGQNREQKFWLDRIDPAGLCPQIKFVAGEMTLAARPPLRWTNMLDRLRRGVLRGSLADAMLRCLPADELDALAQHLLRSSADLDLLQTVMPYDPWFADRIPGLISWRNERTYATPAGKSVGLAATQDLPGTHGGTAQQATLGLILTGFARAATTPRRVACVLATARDEGAYLIEWIAYHRAIGLEHIFLYTNDNSDGSDDLLRLLADAGIISWFRNEVGPGSLPQHRAYGHALSVMPEILDYRWTLISDIDEYAGYDTASFDSMIDYINWQEQRGGNAIALPWKLYIARPQDAWLDSPCIERFPLREPAINSYVKMIFRTNLAWNANPHHPDPSFAQGFNYRAETGEPHMQQTTPAETAKPSARHAWISHYMFRSAPEMMMKLVRGRADRPAGEQSNLADNRLKTFLAQLRVTGLLEDRSTILCGADLAAERARLLAIPGVAKCEAEIKNAYASRMRMACEDFIRSASESDADHIKALRAILIRSRSD